MNTDVMAPVVVRAVRDTDSEQITAIYGWHVTHGCASFEETPPGLADMQNRILKVASLGLPWLVAERHHEVVGYCYATEYRPRPAYRFTIESSVYVAPELGGQGIGLALMTALIAECERGPWRQMLAIIGNGERNRGSWRLHQKLGFELAGTLKAVGFKHGDWRDILIMQRALGAQ